MPPLDRNVGLSRLSARVARQPSRRPRVGGGSRNAGAGRAGPRAGRRAPGHRPVRIITAETDHPSVRGSWPGAAADVVCGAGATCSLVEQTISIVILYFQEYVRDSVAAASSARTFRSA